jgi:hypothetical protein
MDEDLIWAEEVAALLGISVRSLRSQQRKDRAERAKVASQGTDPAGLLYLLPEPVDRQRRMMPARGHDRAADSPRYSRKAIMTYLEHRRGPGGRARTAPEEVPDGSH